MQINPDIYQNPPRFGYDVYRETPGLDRPLLRPVRRRPRLSPSSVHTTRRPNRNRNAPSRPGRRSSDPRSKERERCARFDEPESGAELAAAR